MEGKSYTLKKGTFKSCDKVHDVAYYIFVPECKPFAILQISHGMCEYIMRYEGFADFLCSFGFVVCGNDHLGHGYTAKDDSELGYTGKENGTDNILGDLKQMRDLIKGEYPDIPHVLLGHSMGSFYARLFIAKYGEYTDGAIIMGTAGPESPTAIGKFAAKMNVLFCGEKNVSNLLYKLSFSPYTKKFGKDAPSTSWLTRDESVQDKYAKDKFCNFHFTARGYVDLYDALNRVSKKSWAAKIPKNLPILIVSGEMDPVGNYGKGVMKVYDRIKSAGVKDVSLKLYPDARHEVLNEINSYTVYCDILEWLNYHGFVEKGKING